MVTVVVFLKQSITAMRGIMRQLEDKITKEFRSTSPHAHITHIRTCTHSFYPFMEKQLGDKQSGRRRDEARQRKNANGMVKY